MKIRSWVFVCSLPALGFACSAGSPKSQPACSSTAEISGDYPCNVGEIIQNRCQGCHQNPPQHSAHFSLLRYEDTQQPYGNAGELRWQRMAQVIEPDAVPHMPYQDAGQLSPDELKTLEDWFKACARPVPEGQGCDQGE